MSIPMIGTLLAVALGYGVLWYLLRQNVRFLFPVVPLLAVGVTGARGEFAAG